MGFGGFLGSVCFLGVLGLVVLIAIGVVRAARRAALLRAGGDARTHARVARGDGHSVDALAQRLGTVPDALRGAATSYREVRIPKRRGGERRLLIPDDVTKAMQRRILRRVLGGLRAHPAATGFERGKSIVDNALPHAGQAVVVKLDVIDFFPSTKAERVLRYFQWVGWNRESAEILTRLTTHEDGLPQGAPTSPRLSNLVNFYLDVLIANRATRRGGAYTRYADDITISLPKPNGRRARGMIQFARRMLRRHGYELHERRKLHVVRSHQRQVVTGLVVNGAGSPPPKRKKPREGVPRVIAELELPDETTSARVRLPREIRRRLRATRHRMAKGLPPKQGAACAQGWFAYEKMVDEQARSRAARADSA